MDNNRLETLRQFLETRPNDCFVRYGIAQELAKAERYDEAIVEFKRILEIDADYQAAYYHAGKTYEKMGLAEEARAIYQSGIEASRRTGDLHARGELEAALDQIG